ncbi:MAG TPA: ABC transporter substrate-binding protein [Bradyrhizobium sp.]|nr:ABC transporter substrate-binding protein [Bradyrhizobium sp.]
MIGRRQFITLLGGAAVVGPLAARAQQAERVRRIGVLMGAVESDPARQSQLAAFRGALAKLGWREGSNLGIEVRWGGDPELCARYAAELVALGPEVILADASPSVEALQRQTRTIPIVFVTVADPIGQGFVANLAHPGGNTTGFSVFDAPMAGKWLEMLTQITPPVTRVAMLFNPATTPYANLMFRAMEDAAPSFAVAVRAAPVNSESEVDAMMAALAREGRGGVLVLTSIFTVTHRDAIIALAARHRLPAVYAYSFFAEAGGLMSYGVDVADVHRRAADYVNRILKGDKPGDLPVQMPIKFNLVINLKTAKALDITVATSLLATADEVIE